MSDPRENCPICLRDPRSGGAVTAHYHPAPLASPLDPPGAVAPTLPVPHQHRYRGAAFIASLIARRQPPGRKRRSAEAAARKLMAATRKALAVEHAPPVARLRRSQVAAAETTTVDTIDRWRERAKYDSWRDWLKRVIDYRAEHPE